KKPPSPLMIELPSYKMPSLKTAFMTAYDRSFIFMRKAGTVILAISIILWWLMSYPRLDGSATASAATDDASGAMAAQAAADDVNEAQLALSHSYAGRMGKLVEPVLAPLGFDWKIGVGIVASFAAREVVVSALSVIYGVGDEGAENDSLLLDKLRTAKRADGTPVFTFATSASLLVFYVLAMQCLPTQAITHRETGSWKWAGLQVAYMTCLAYAASFIAYNAITFFGGA
ncbi:MAG: ferrous iron transporter B, partial [Candidatus Hydrogenedentes bacterium]|nr:ferrous iron transporter B [Candidatus Hydrogenedentota bacterium]